MQPSRSPSPAPSTPPLSLSPLSPSASLGEADALESTTVRGASARPPNTEVYGFVMYLASILTYGVYLVWAYVPDPVLHQLGITYHPSKWWAVALPMYTLVALAYIMCVFLANTLLQTAPLDSAHAVTDEHAAVVENLGSHTFKNDDRVPDLMDIPISVANRCMFVLGTDDDAAAAAARSGRLRRPWPSQPNLVALSARVASGSAGALSPSPARAEPG